MAKKPKAALPDIALGSWEAACVAGVHFTRIKRMAAAGALIYRPMDSAWTTSDDGPQNEFLLYSLHDCLENYREYLAMAAAGEHKRRPRAEENLAQHEPMLAKLAAVEPIIYDDAISTAQAASIMGCHVTYINSLIRRKKLRARVAMNDRRRSGGRVYIVSRRACEEMRAHSVTQERRGAKPGPRLGPPSPAVRRVEARKKKCS